MYIIINPNGEIKYSDHPKTGESHAALVVLRIDSEVTPSSVTVAKNALAARSEVDPSGKPAKGSILAWISGGKQDVTRSIEIWPVKDDSALVRVKLHVNAKKKTEFAEGTADSIQDAFDKAYAELTEWVI